MKRNVVSKRSLVRGGLTVLAVALVSACSVLPKAEDLSIYQLPPASALSASSAPVAGATSSSSVSTSPRRPGSGAATADWSLRVSTPQSSDLLNSTRILVQRDGTELGVYKGARWSDTAPKLFRNRLIDVFRADGNLAAVLGDTSRAQADRELTGDLLAFQTEYDASGAASAWVRFDAALVDTRSARVVATRRFEVTQPLQGGLQVPQVVDALGTATDELAAQIVAWALAQPGPARR
jgi:cholesterol transport system auxiliary component